MIGRTVRTNIGGTLDITSLMLFGDKGGQGKVYQTSNPDYLIKVWEPVEDPVDYEATREETRRRYRTFSQLRFKDEEELRCLPLESVEVDGRPAYVMARAIGKEMKEEWESFIQLNLVQRIRIARSLANGISVLHGRGVVHADIKRDNFFFDPQTCLVQILDIDGGGYCGRELKIGQFLPNVLPLPKYMAPELRRNKFPWNSVWEDERRRMQPDL